MFGNYIMNGDILPIQSRWQIAGVYEACAVAFDEDRAKVRDDAKHVRTWLGDYFSTSPAFRRLLPCGSACPQYSRLMNDSECHESR
jgi:hypothetical protein